jgi:hypothetical protein|tara:strand:- start:775 stop:1272 length:498 start_codon:yes stop_codon:yes gene_type:complete
VETPQLSHMQSYYLSQDWRQRRELRLKLDGYTCQGCGITQQQLNDYGWKSLEVHHKNAGPPDFKYPSFGNEQMSDLLTLCSSCHDGITNSVRNQRYKLDPSKQVSLTSLASVQVNLSSAKQKHHEVYHCQDQGRITIAPPQRSSSKSEESIRKIYEANFGEAKKS